MKLVVAVLVVVLALAPAGMAVEATIGSRVAKLERVNREQQRRINLLANVLYLSGSGLLPRLLQTQMDVERANLGVAVLRHEIYECIRYQVVGGDRVAVLNPACFDYREAP